MAKELKEARWKKETEFWWIEYHCGDMKEHWELREKPLIKCRLISAPLATEILEELPDKLGNLEELTIHKLPKGAWRVNYWDNEKLKVIQKFDKSLPNALAKMWLYLRKEKLI